LRKILARHRWVADATITESYDTNEEFRVTHRRFTATVDGYRNFRIYDGELEDGLVKRIIAKVESIKTRIRSGDETILHENTLLEN